MTKILEKNHVVISVILILLENFEIFLMMKMIEKVVRFGKFLGAVRGRYSQLPVQFSLKSENFYYDFKMIFF